MNQRISPTTEQTSCLFKAIESRSNENPWRDVPIRERNLLVFLLLLSLGINVRDLQKARLAYVDCEERIVLNAQRPSEADSPSKVQFKTTAADRLKRHSAELAGLIRQPILRPRTQQDGAPKHSVLFVANGAGAPLSSIACSKVFAQFRERNSDAFDKLRPSQLRRAWNYLLSAKLDECSVNSVTDPKIRT